MQITRRTWVLVVIVVLITGGIGLWRSGFVPEIGRFFAAEIPVPSYSFVFPDGGGQAIAGGKYTLKWDPLEFGSDTVNIFLEAEGAVEPPVAIKTEAFNSGSFLWEVPLTLSGPAFRIRIDGDGGNQRVSGQTFGIIAPKPLTIRSVPVPATFAAYQPGSMNIPVLAFEIINPYERDISFSSFSVVMQGTANPAIFTDITWDTGNPDDVLGTTRLGALGTGSGERFGSIGLTEDNQGAESATGCLAKCPSLLTVPAGASVIVYVRADTVLQRVSGDAQFLMTQSSHAYTVDRVPIYMPNQPIFGQRISISGEPISSTPPPTCVPLPACLTENPACAFDPLPGVTYCQTPTPPPTSPPGWVALNFGSYREIPVTPGQTIDVPMYVSTGSSVAGVAYATAVKLHIYVGGNAVITGATINPLITQAFEEVLDEPFTDGKTYTVTLGSGADGGVSMTDEPHGTHFLTLHLRMNSSAQVGDTVELNFGPGTEVAVEGYSGNAIQGMGGLRLTVGASVVLPGDADGDGDVDIFDYNIVVSNFGRSGPSGDLDADGDVDIFDYNLVVSNFGK